MKQKSIRNVAVGTVKKSMAAVSAAWFFRNVRHVGDEGLPDQSMYFLTVDSATSWPSKASSARILGAPQVRFSRDIFLIRLRISLSTFGLPPLRPLMDFHVQ